MALVDSVSKYTLTFGATDLSKSTALTGVTTPANCVPFYTCRVTAAATFDSLEAYCVDVYISGSNVQADRIDDQDAQLVVEVHVVEFGSDATVQSGTFSIADLSSSATVVSGSGGPDVSTAQLPKTFTVHSWETNDSGDMGSGMVTAELSDASGGTITFKRGQSSNAINGHWFTVTDTGSNFTVERGTADMNSGAGTDTLNDVTLTTAVSKTKGMLIWSAYFTQIAVDPDDIPRAFLYDSDSGGDYDTVRCERFNGGGDGYVSYEVVAFSGNENVESGQHTQTSQTASDTETITLASGDVADAIAFGGFGSLVQGSVNSGTSAYVADSQVGYTLSTNTLTIQRFTGAAGPVDFRYPWTVVTWDVGGSPPPARRVMVIT